MSVKAALSRVVTSAGPTFRRFWVPVGFCVMLTVTLIRSLGSNLVRPDDDLMRTSLALVPCVLMGLCTIFFWERERRTDSGRIGSELMGNLIALPAAGLSGWLIYRMLDNLTFIPMTRYAATCVFLVLAFFLTPHIRKEGSFEMYVVRLFSNAVVSVLFSGVMFMGLSGITFTISSLFTLKVSSTIYIKIWLAMMCSVAPFLFMAGIPKGTVSPATQDYPKVLKNLALFVIAPLLTAYTLVLYVYFAKILLTRQWPVGLVSHLVLWYSMVGAAFLFLIWPLGQDNKWGEIFSSYFPKAIIPLLFMMFASIGIRIRYYGITENRYYVLVFGAWVLASMIYLVFVKKRRSLLLPASLAIVVVFSVLGPWSSFSISKWSQNRRFEGLLTKYGMLQGGAIVASTETVSAEDRKELAEILFYFNQRYSLSDVRTLPAGFQLGDFEKVFGFSYSDAQSPEKRRYVHYQSETQSFGIEGYQYLFDFTGLRGEKRVISLSQKNVEATYNMDTHKVQVSLDGTVKWEKSLSDHMKSLGEKYRGLEDIQFRSEDMTIVKETDNLRLKLVITNLWGDLGGSDQAQPRVENVGFYILVGRK